MDFLLVRDQRVGPEPVHYGGGGGCVRQAFRFEERMGDVDPEAVHAFVEPEAEHAFEVVAHRRVPPIPVGLAGREEVQVPLGVGFRTRVCTAPGLPAEHALPVVGRQVAGGVRAGAAAFDEVEQLPLRRARACRDGLLE
ncbi:hypothetical protein D9M72_610980 [compost metagenome]